MTEPDINAMYSRSAEVAILGSMVLDPDCIGHVAELIHPTDFYLGANVAVFRALVQLEQEGQLSKDDMIILLEQKLKDDKDIESVGIDYIIELAECVTSPAGYQTYIKIVKDKARFRALRLAAQNILVGIDNNTPIDEIAQAAESEIFKATETVDTTTGLSPMDEIITDMNRILAARLEKGGTITGVSSGFHALDNELSGFQPAELTIIAARPSMGKTAFAMQIVEYAATIKKLPTAVVSLEMSKLNLAERMLCSISEVDSQKLKKNMSSANELEKIKDTALMLSQSPIYIDDSPALTIGGLRTKARRMKQAYNIQLLVVDYLQLMYAPGKNNRQEEVSEISKGLKAIAKELDIPVLCLSQLNRNNESREDKRPNLSDLRESGSIEQDADVVLMLHREAYYHKGDEMWANANPELVNAAQIIIAKNRNGPTNSIALEFNGDTIKFVTSTHVPKDDSHVLRPEEKNTNHTNQFSWKVEQ